MTRIALDVPFSRKEEARALGARWDTQEKSWFTRDSGPRRDALLNLFPPIDEERPAGIPATVTCDWSLPGEDRSFGGNALFIDMVPSSCWFTNVRSAVAPRHWKAVRLAVLSRAGHQCECCAGPELPDGLECHERWAFDEGSRVQTLKRLVALCGACHETTHFGRAQVGGREAVAFRHLMDVNRWTEAEAHRHVQEAFDLWRNRSRFTWDLDLSIITRAGIALHEPSDGVYRARMAEQRLDIAKRAESSR